MKKWKQIGKCLLALLLVMILGIQVFRSMNTLEVRANIGNVTTSTEGKVINGDFESGRDGYSVRSWSMTPTDANRKEEEASKWKNNFSLRTVTEQNGNKVAELKKTGAGYMAMTSQEIAVTSLKDYRMSVDYKVQEITFDEAAAGVTTGVTPYRLVFYVEEISESNTSTYTYYVQTEYTQKVTPGWENFTTQFKTKVDTKKVVIYCWLGGEYRVNETVLFDNIELSAHDDYAIVNSSFDKLTYQAEGGRPEGIAGAAGWNLVSCAKGGTGTSSTAYNQQFAATVADVDSRDHVVAVTHLNYQTAGYVMLESSFIPVEAGQVCDIAADCKLVCRDINGEEVLSDTRFKGMRIVLIPFDENQNALARQYGGWYADTKNSDGNNVWEKISWTGRTTPANTKYIKICFYVGYNLDSDSTNTATEDYNFTYYFDNIGLDVDDKSLGYTQYTSKNAGAIDTTIERRPSYGIRKFNGGKGYEDAVQLYVTEEARAINGVLFCRELSSVEENVQYRVDLDMKIEDVADSTKSTGADIVLRYLDAQKALLSTVALYNNDTNKQNMDWTYKTYSSTAPAGAKYVEIGLQIGINTANANPDMKHSFANIVIAEKDDTVFWDKYIDTKIDPAVTSSSIYKQSALFVGDSIGIGLAEQAVSYSKMQVTNVCSDTISVTEQLKVNAGIAYDYLVISGGMQEKLANIPAGEIKTDDILDLSAGTFAGVMEHTLGKIVEHYNQPKVVYVLTTPDAEYRAVAEAAANKWGIELVKLDDTADAYKNWQDIIDPAEKANILDYYQVVGLLEYLTKKVDTIAATELDITSDVASLENIKEIAQNCPDTNAKYTDFQVLVNHINSLLSDFQEFRPSICGATIATDDPNVLYFIGLAPKRALTEGVTVKAMGILSMPAEDLDGNAILSLDNSDAKNMEVTYKEASQDFRARQEAWDADPYTKYTATAYVVYEVNGENYVFYSTNDYVNTLGTKTAEDGRCTKSIFGISQTVALQLLDAKEKEMDFAAIGGENNIPLIAQATEDSDVSLLDVYRLVGDNKAVLKEWLDKGGVAK